MLTCTMPGTIIRRAEISSGHRTILSTGLGSADSSSHAKAAAKRQETEVVRVKPARKSVQAVYVYTV